jgi:D-alanyl-D-alanine carboxypeptidase
MAIAPSAAITGCWAGSNGVDGIKTGYTRASGFNLMTSAKTEGRQIVSIVLGGRSGASRDKIMADLVLANLPRAATTGRASTMVAEAPEQEEPPRRPATVAAPPQPVVTAAVAEPAPLPVPRPRIQQQEAPIPAAARAYTALSATTTTPIAPPRPIHAGAPPLQISNMRTVTATTTPSAMRWSIGAPAADGKVLRPPANVDVTSSIAKVAEPEEQPAAPKLSEAKPQEAKIEQRKIELRHPEVAPAIAEKKTDGGMTALAKAAPDTKASDARPAPVVASGKWIIQLGATDDEAKAKDILARARSKASGPLAVASGFTEKVEKGGATLFRARFAGFDDSKDANNACAKLKRDGFACFATRS